MRRTSAFQCPATLTLAEPAEPSLWTGRRLRTVFGDGLDYPEQGWLLYAAEGSPPVPEMLASDPEATLFGYVGAVDQVVLQVDSVAAADSVLLASSLEQEVPMQARLRLVADRRWRTLQVLARMLTVQGRPTAGRYVSLLADRYDERGLRVERVVGLRCKPEPFDYAGLDRMAAELVPFDGLFWWGSDQGPG